MQYYVTRLDENFREESQEIREFDGTPKDLARILGEQELAKYEETRALISKISGKECKKKYRLTITPKSAVISKTGGIVRGIECVILVEEDPSHRWDKLLKDLGLMGD